jgi:hypothetical protein
MNRGKEWWIQQIAGAIVTVALWGLALFEATTPGELKILWIAILTIWLPDATKSLVGILLRIRLAHPFDEPNFVVSRESTGYLGRSRNNMAKSIQINYLKSYSYDYILYK